MHRGIVKLNALADTNGAGAQNHNRRLGIGALRQKFRRLVFLIVGRVKIGSFRRKFRRAGVHHLVNSPRRLSHRLAGKLSNHLVGEAHPLGRQIFLLVVTAAQAGLHSGNFSQLMQKPQVNFSNIVNLFQINAALNRLINDEKPLIRALVQSLTNFLVAHLQLAVSVQIAQANFRPTHRFHQGLLKVQANSHHLAGGFHLSAQIALGVNKLIKRPLGELHHHIINGRLKGRGRFARHRVFNLIQSVANGNFGGHLSNRIARGLGGQGRGAGNTRIYLNHGILKTVGV